MLSFALQVELQTILTGQSSMETLSSGLSKIQSQADGINRAFTAMSRGLMNIGSKIEPVVLEMGILSGSAKMAMNNMRTPDMSHLLSQINQANQSYYQMEQTLRAITAQMEKMNLETKMAGGAATARRGAIGGVVPHKENESFLGSMAKGYIGMLGIQAGAEAFKGMIHSAAELQTQISNLRLMGFSDQQAQGMLATVRQANVRGVSDAEGLTATRELQTIFGPNTKIEKETLSDALIEAKVLKTFTGEGTIESHMRNTLRASEVSGGGGTVGGKMDQGQFRQQMMQFTRGVIAGGKNFDSDTFRHNFTQTSQFLRERNMPMTDDLLAKLVVLTNNLGQQGGTAFQNLISGAEKGTTLNSVLFRKDMMEYGLIDPSKRELGIDPKNDKPVMDMRNTLRGYDPAHPELYPEVMRQGIRRHLDQENRRKGLGPATEQEVNQVSDKFLNRIQGRAASALYSEYGADQVAQAKETLANEPKTTTDMLKLTESFNDSVDTLEKSFVNLGSTVGGPLTAQLTHFNYGLASVINSFKNWSVDNPKSMQAITVGAEVVAGLLGFSAAIKLVTMTVSFVGGAFTTLASGIKNLVGVIASVASRLAVLAMTPTGVVAGLAGAGAYAAYETGKKSATIGAMAEDLGLAVEQVDPNTGMASSYYGNGRGGIQDDEIKKMYEERHRSDAAPVPKAVPQETFKKEIAPTTPPPPVEPKARLHQMEYESPPPRTTRSPILADRSWATNPDGTIPPYQNYRRHVPRSPLDPYKSPIDHKPAIGPDGHIIMPNTTMPVVPGQMPPRVPSSRGGLENQNLVPDLHVGDIYARSIIVDSRLLAGSSPTNRGSPANSNVPGGRTNPLLGTPGLQGAPGEPNIIPPGMLPSSQITPSESLQRYYAMNGGGPAAAGASGSLGSPGLQGAPGEPNIIPPGMLLSSQVNPSGRLGSSGAVPNVPGMNGSSIPTSRPHVNLRPQMGPDSAPVPTAGTNSASPANVPMSSITGMRPQAVNFGGGNLGGGMGNNSDAAKQAMPVMRPQAGNLSGNMGKSMGINSDAAKQAMQFMQQKGWSKTQAAGIAANMFAESGFNPRAVGDGGQAYGIGQWHPDRQAMFQKLFGHSIRGSSLEEQMIFYDWELHNTEKRAGDHLKTATTVSGAVGAVLESERPANRAMEQMRRSGYGNTLMQSFPGNDPNQILPKPASADTSSLMAQNTNPDIVNVPRQSQTHVHDIGVHLDGEVIGRSVFESQLDFSPAASSSQTGYDWRLGAIAPGMSLRA